MKVEEIIEWLTKVKPFYLLWLGEMLTTFQEEGLVEPVAVGKNIEVAPQSSAGVRINLIGNTKLYVLVACQPQEEWIFKCVVEIDGKVNFTDDLLTRVSGITMLLRRPFLVNRYINVSVFNNHTTESRIIKIIIFGFEIPPDVYDFIRTYLRPWEWSK